MRLTCDEHTGSENNWVGYWRPRDLVLSIKYRKILVPVLLYVYIVYTVHYLQTQWYQLGL